MELISHEKLSHQRENTVRGKGNTIQLWWNGFQEKSHRGRVTRPVGMNFPVEKKSNFAKNITSFSFPSQTPVFLFFFPQMQKPYFGE